MNRKNRLRRMSLQLLIAAIVAGTGGLAQAATVTWSGATSSDWSDASNWSPAVVPGSGDGVVFPSSASRFSVTVDGARTIDALEFASNNSSGYTLSGDPISLESGNLLARSGGEQHVIECDIVLLANGAWRITGATVVLVDGDVGESGGSFGFEKRGGSTLYP